MRVSLICPGFIKTALTDKNDFKMPFLKSPEYAADKIYDGLVNKKSFEIIFPIQIAIIYKIFQILPNRIYNYLISKFELDSLKDIKGKFLSGGQKKKLVIALSLLSEPRVLLLDECFAALDVLTIKMLQEIIVNLQNENRITICICDHQARDLLACVDMAMILSNGKIIAQDTPSNLVKNINAKNAYFGDNFKFN